MERLRPFTQLLRTACGALDVPVLEALCVSGGKYWSYCCPDIRCCPPEGTPLALPGTTVMAAAAAYAGIQVRGSLRELEQRLTPWTGTHASAQLRALDEVGAAMVARILDTDGRGQVARRPWTWPGDCSSASAPSPRPRSRARPTSATTASSAMTKRPP